MRRRLLLVAFRVVQLAEPLVCAGEVEPVRVPRARRLLEEPRVRRGRVERSLDRRVARPLLASGLGALPGEAHKLPNSAVRSGDCRLGERPLLLRGEIAGSRPPEAVEHRVRRISAAVVASTLTTTLRPNAVSSATKTRDMPPPPSSRSRV